MLIEKEVISPGTYWYEDQKTGIPKKWVVTADITKHLHEQGNAMLSHGLTVPIPCEHDFDAHPMTPADKLKSNAGWVKEYRLRDGALFAALDIQDEDLVKKLPKTIRWTSPWISSFTDGSGRSWNNVVAHLALTTRPRVMKQAPFSGISAAMAFALTLTDSPPGPKDGITLSRAGRLIQKDGKFRPEYPIAFSLYSGGIALAKEDMPEKKIPPETDDDDDMPDDDVVEPMADPTGDVKMEELLCDLLGALGIQLPDNVSEEQFKRSLYTAAMNKIKELTGHETPPDMNKSKTAPNNPLVHQEQQPMYMSLEEINKIEDTTMKSIALAMHTENAKLRGELEANTKVTASLRDAKLKEADVKRKSRIALLGKALPSAKVDLDAMLALPTMALSMGEGGDINDPMAQTLVVLEKGLKDLPSLLTTDRTALSVQPQPTDADMLTEERVEALADSFARQMGAVGQKKAS
jgi:hypothetical protein